MNRRLLLALTSLLVSQSLHADSWPQFRGPDSSATGPEGVSVPTEWGEGKNLKWKTQLPGAGSSSPILWGDRLFVTCYTGYGVNQEDPGEPGDLGRQVLCLDRNTGKILWKRGMDVANEEDDYRGYLTEHGYASATPVTDGEHVYAFFGKSGVHAFTLDGKPVWSRQVGKQSSNRRWGSAASPVLHGELVIVNAADEARAVIAFDKKTGDERWRYESEKLELAYGTPQVHTPAGGSPEMVLSAPEELFALDPATGKRLWHAATNIPGNVSPSVVIAKDTIFTTGGWPRKGTVAVKGGGKGDVTGDILWTAKTYSYVPTPLVIGDHYYWVNDEADAIVMEIATGKVVRKKEVEGIAARRKMSFYASLVRVGDKLIAVSRRNGTFVFEADPGMKQVAHNTLGDRSDFNATPAVAKDALYLRSNKAVYCIAE